MFDLTQIRPHKQRAMGHNCARKTCLIRLSKRTKVRQSNTRTKEMFSLFGRMFDGLQILSETRPNTIKQHQKRWPNCKMFGHQTMFDVVWLPTFPVWTGLKRALSRPTFRAALKSPLLGGLGACCPRKC